jgi:DNA helicase HerA-like ATPase
MPVLGRAIAGYLSSLGGLYSVELPESLSAEMVALVHHANSMVPVPNRAFLVSSATPDAGMQAVTIGWRDLLAWRTDEDRIFVWQRGLHEPDSSFQSVVRPFISGRFPGAGGGECTVSVLVRACTRELWRGRGWLPSGDTYEAFLETTAWVTELLDRLFERAGNTPGVHWSDRFLVHFASMLDNLDAGLASFSSVVAPRHAWEVVRLSGLPLPSAVVSDANPFLEAPRRIATAQMEKLIELWHNVTQSLLLREGALSELLLALDRESVGPVKLSPWRDMDWNRLQTLALDSPAPVVGAAVFASPPSPTLLAVTIPNTSAPDRPSWWGVTTDHLEAALAHLRKSVPLSPDDACPGFGPLGGSESKQFVLETRLGLVSHSHTPRKWRATVSLTGLGLHYKEDWKALYVGDAEPESADAGDAWIAPGSVGLQMKGCRFSEQEVTASPSGQLRITFGVHVEYTASRNEQSNYLSGEWTSDQKLKATLAVKLRRDGQWDAARRVETEINVIIPSPYSPTVVVVDEAKLETVGPDDEDTFTASDGSSWSVATTPTIVLAEEGRYGVRIYDGVLEPWVPAFRDVAEPAIGGTAVPMPTGGLFALVQHDLDDGVVVTDTNRGIDLAVFQVKARSNNLSSGILSAVRGLPSGRRPPAAAARQSILGQYQSSITPVLCGSAPDALDSLYQYVIAASDEPITWLPHHGGPAPQILFSRPTTFTLPGVGDGPTAALVATPEWEAFMAAMGQVFTRLGLRPGTENVWLSGVDPSRIDGGTIVRALQAQRALIEATTRINSPADRFWASYPFSIVMVEGNGGANFGQVQAVLLSPMHPARLAWGYAVSAIARRSTLDHGLLGLLESWNIPAVGTTLNPAGERRWLVAVPIDPGSEQDFIGWSALAVLGPGGTVELPVAGGGQPLPWGGKTGINARVVERALRDHLVVHPHLNALEVDIRSVGESPRSKEIDDTLLDLLGAGGLEGMSFLGGGVKIWDSLDRRGNPPTRDQLFARRPSQERDRSFEWQVYSAARPPADADLALVENATVHLAVTAGTAHGLLGVLPLRRFSPTDLTGTRLDQNFLPRDGEDILGLASLLRSIEAPGGEDKLCMRANPQLHALGIGRGGEWEVLGTFNIDPSVLATLVATAPTASGRRLLWEWRPSWMVTDKKTADLARRPYYVIARVPASLSIALHARQGISESSAQELLTVLGQRGIGLAALNAESGTQESAAAGFFYATQTLSTNKGGDPFHKLPSAQRPLVYGVLPLDPVEPILQALASRSLQMRADMLAVAVSRADDGALRLCLVPIEVKHHGMPATPEKIPAATNSELKRAREQLTATVILLQDFIASIATRDPSEAALRYLKRLGLATLVDLTMSFSSNAPTALQRATILSEVLGGRLQIGIGDPILLWFAPGCINTAARACVVDPYPSQTVGPLRVREIYIDPCAVPGLWWHATAIQQADSETRDELDEVIRSSFVKCGTGATSIGPNRHELARLLGVDVEGAARGTSPSEPAPARATSGESGAVNESLGTGQLMQDHEQRVPIDGLSAPAERISSPSTPPASEGHPGIIAAKDDTPKAADVSPAPEEALSPQIETPRFVIGWSSLTTRWTSVGRLAGGNELVALDLDHPKTLGIFGYMGSGKSYLLGTIVESAVLPIPGVNSLPAPLAVVIFNYRRNASDRFELNSFAFHNQDAADVERLASEYRAHPAVVSDIRILCLPGELRPARLQEYDPVQATELFFDPRALDVEDWELLMGEPGSDAVFARTIRNTLVDLRAAGDVTLDHLDHEVGSRLSGQSRSAARLRFDFVRRYISESRAVRFDDLLRPGRTVIVDLRQPLFNKDDALRFFLVCANHVSRVQGQFNKLIIFDEAHEYMSEAFGERMESRIRQMRHEGTSYVFATQDVRSIPSGISRFVTTRFVFNLGTRENVQDLEGIAPEFRGLRLLDIKPGHCLVQSNTSTQGIFALPRQIRVRPRVTRHGGASRIFTTP